jgi:hypothetical protein
LSQTAEDVVRSLVKQLVSQLDGVPEKVKNAYIGSRSCGDPSRGEFIALLRDCFKVFSTVFILLDAFDECVDQERVELLRNFQQLPTSQLRLYITTRTHLLKDLTFNKALQHLEESQEQHPLELEIKARSGDIKRFLVGELESRPKVAEFDAAHKDHIINAISLQADGQ